MKLKCTMDFTVSNIYIMLVILCHRQVNVETVTRGLCGWGKGPWGPQEISLHFSEREVLG